jgi:predicted Zn finger-like uncharacterized protein
MPIVCPNCATSYGVEVASLRRAGGRTGELRCRRCRWIWQAQLSAADKLLVAANTVPPVRRAMLAVAQAAAAPARSRGPRLRRATTFLAEELEASGPEQHAPVRSAGLDSERTDPEPVRGWVLPVERIAAIAGSGLARVSRVPLSRLQCLVLALAFTDAAIIGWRADLVSAMPQTASFYAQLGLPVNLRGIHFDQLAAKTEWHEGERVLVVNGKIGNDTSKTKDVPHLRFAIRNAQRQEIYSWTAAPARGTVSAGAILAFHSELAVPPPDTRDVVVQFVDRQNNF